MISGLGLTYYSLPVLASALILALNKQHSVLVRWLPTTSFLLSAVMLLLSQDASLSLASVFVAYSAIYFAQTRSVYDFSSGKLMQVLLLIQGVFAIETLTSYSVFKIFWGLSAILFLQMFRNYLATDDKKMTALELSAYWLVLLVFWWVLLLHPSFTMSLMVEKQMPLFSVLFLLGFSILAVFLQYLPWRGFRNLSELHWLNAGLLFHLLLQARLVLTSEFFMPRLFVGDIAGNGIRWLLFALPIVALLMINKSTDGLRRLSLNNYLAYALLMLFYSTSPSGNGHILFVAILFIAFSMLIQNYAFELSSKDLKVGSRLGNRMLLVFSMFMVLMPLSGALRPFFSSTYRQIFSFEEYASIFYFPTLLILVLAVISIINALILCNDKLLLNDQDAWVLRKSDVLIAFLMLPFIFLGIYPSPLYNYIQKYFIFP